MKNRLFYTVAVSQLLAAAVAQNPVDASTRPAGAPEAKLHSLQLLLTETIFARQPLATPPTPDAQQKPGAPGAGAGSTGDRPFAIVRDATFEPGGRLTALIVEAPTADNGRGSPRVLPARSVQWDEATKRWLVAEVSLQWAELAEFKTPGMVDPSAKDPNTKDPAKEPAPNETDPVTSVTQRPVLASELLNARLTGFEPEASGKSETIDTKGGVKPRVVWWISPLHEQLAFAVVGHGDKFLALPWALMRTSGQGGATEVRVQAQPTAVEGAPTVASAMEQPALAVRHASYKHYGVEVPKWDESSPQTAQGADKSSAKSDRSGSEGKPNER